MLRDFILTVGFIFLVFIAILLGVYLLAAIGNKIEEIKSRRS